MMARTRYRIYDNAYPYFLTCTAAAWLPIFTRPECVQIVLDSWKFLQSRSKLTLFGYVILENHLHFVASGDALSDTVGDFKSFTARKILYLLEQKKEAFLLEQLRWAKHSHRTESRYQVWQEGSKPKQIISDEMMNQKLEYIHNNPVKRGYVDEPTHWRYSSARNYAEMESLISVMTDWMWGNVTDGAEACDAERRDLRSPAERGNEVVG